jgi:putative NADH-flavin reductase
MKISILGSTGFLGKVLLEKALDKGYEIKTLVRNPEKLGEFKERVEFIQGNVFNVNDIEKAVSDCDVVISTVGPPQRNPGNPEIYKKGIEDLVAVLEKKNIRRYIHIGGAAHPGGENENWTLGRKFLRIFLRIFAKPILEAKYLEWEVLKKSKLEWTLVRPPRISKAKSEGKKIMADDKNLASMQVNVDDLAGFIIDQITSGVWLKKAPLVSNV